jgi:hypothetical protein
MSRPSSSSSRPASVSRDGFCPISLPSTRPTWDDSMAEVKARPGWRKRLRLLRRSGPRVRHHPAGYAHALAQLHRRGALRRHRLQHRRRLLVRPRPAQPARHPLSLQLHSGTISPAATSTCATRRRASTGAPRQRPTRRDAGLYECRHGTAYTDLQRYKGIAAEILYFVPPSPVDEPAPCELWVLNVRNTERPRAACARSATPSSASPTPSAT